jgi:hypothetical protein
MFGVDEDADPRGEASKAYYFDSGGDIISLVNSAELNFTDKITISFWVKLTSLDEESFIISHGSWEERWKVSVTPDNHLRWTIKTSTGAKDLDSSFPLEFNHYYHFAVVYSGYSLELYADGELDTFLINTGSISTTGKALTMGRKDGSVTRYSLFGTLDEVRIYNAALSPEEINALKSTWNTLVTGTDKISEATHLYPNPARRDFYITGVSRESLAHISVFDASGREINFTAQFSEGNIRISIPDDITGLLIVEIQTHSGFTHKKVFIH